MKAFRVLLFIAAMAGVFVAGYGYGRWYAVPGTAQASLEKPSGVPAKLVPQPGLPMGTIQISPKKQQLIGVKYGVVESGPGEKRGVSGENQCENAGFLDSS